LIDILRRMRGGNCRLSCVSVSMKNELIAKSHGIRPIDIFYFVGKLVTLHQLPR
jgi:hypothetical protein